MSDDRSRKLLHVGLDDIDSQFNGCTTHLAYLVVKELLRSTHVDFVDYPNLVRLNPSIPFRTRGNGAVALRMSVPESECELVVNIIKKMVEDYVSNYEDMSGCEPGLAAVVGDVPVALSKLYMKALTDFVHRDYVMNVIEKTHNLILPTGISRGVVGALAAIGWAQGSDCTYELIAYRKSSANEDRCVDNDSVRRVDLKYRDHVFNNYDYEEGRVLITPHGYNPVLVGIRGEEPEILVKYFNELNICEEFDGYMIFRSNQGTDSHLINRSSDEVRTYRTLCVEATIKSKPEHLRGGDVIVEIDTNPPAYAVFYKETSLTKVASELGRDDEVILCGSVKQWSNFLNVINVEKIFIKRKIRTQVHNPKCPSCGSRMKSAGTNKGFKCERCGFKTLGMSKVVVETVEDVNKLYTTRTRMMKHLTKPLCRYGKEKRCTYTKPVGSWVI